MTLTTTHRLPMILDEVEVVAVERLSPTYVRVELGSPVLADFGVDGPLYDQRIKLVFPNDAGTLPSFEGADESWFAAWLEIPASARGHMRTYTVREVRGTGVDTRLVVDLALHLDDGATGPGSAWASRASVGDRLVLVGPRKGQPFGGIEFVPGTARLLMMAADETAVPAVCSILEDLPSAACGVAFLEVPDPADVQDVDHPVGVEVLWLPRGEHPLGARLHAAVLDYLGTGSVPLVEPEDVDPDLWETPDYSSSGEEVGSVGSGAEERYADLYAWIAGESGVVTALRRHLVKELGMDRRQVAFMGYWRRGVAMRS
jgi:NADPH-dependent ferric siderophore reductase